jgi:hypothetical protein
MFDTQTVYCQLTHRQYTANWHTDSTLPTDTQTVHCQLTHRQCTANWLTDSTLPTDTQTVHCQLTHRQYTANWHTDSTLPTDSQTVHCWHTDSTLPTDSDSTLLTHRQYTANWLTDSTLPTDSQTVHCQLTHRQYTANWHTDSALPTDTHPDAPESRLSSEHLPSASLLCVCAETMLLSLHLSLTSHYVFPTPLPATHAPLVLIGRFHQVPCTRSGCHPTAPRGCLSSYGHWHVSQLLPDCTQYSRRPSSWITLSL